MSLLQADSLQAWGRKGQQLFVSIYSFSCGRLCEIALIINMMGSHLNLPAFV